MYFHNAVFTFFRDCLNKVRTKLKNAIKSFEMTLNSRRSKKKEKLKTKEIGT